jgi:hypothetical protein
MVTLVMILSTTLLMILKYIFTQLNLNIGQWRWLELIKVYELEVHYHLGKANIVADTLSRKAHWNYLPAVPLTREESIAS